VTYTNANDFGRVISTQATVLLDNGLMDLDGQLPCAPLLCSPDSSPTRTTQ